MNEYWLGFLSALILLACWIAQSQVKSRNPSLSPKFKSAERLSIAVMVVVLIPFQVSITWIAMHSDFPEFSFFVATGIALIGPVWLIPSLIAMWRSQLKS